MKTKLVVLHGGPGLRAEYLKNHLRDFSDLWDVCPIEYLGWETNSSEKVPTLRQTLDDVYLKIKKISSDFTESFDVLAHSWGSYVLLELFRQNPNLTSGKLIFVTPCPTKWVHLMDVGTRLQKILKKRLSETQLKRLSELQPDGNGPSDKEYISLLSPAYVYDMKNAAALQSLNYSRKIENKLTSEMTNFDQSSLIRSLKNDMTLILGSTDFILPEDLPDHRAVAKKTIILNEVGHSPFIENAKDFFNAFTN